MKKLISLLLCLCMVFTLVACGAADAPAADAPAADAPAVDAPAAEKTYVIGFNNYNMGTDFPQLLYNGMEVAAKELGIELMYAEAAGDPQKMVSNIDTFITAGVDLIIDFNFNPEVGATLVQKCNDADIPLISIDCVYDGAYFFGVNNMNAGKTAGEYYAQLVKDKWGGEVDYLVLEYNFAAGTEVKQRLDGIIEGMKENGIELTEDQIVWIDYNNDTAKAQSTAADFLTAHPDSTKIAFGVLTDPASAGVLAAIETADRMSDCMIVSHGGEPIGLDLLAEDNCYMGTVAYDPAKYGELLIPLAKDIIDGVDAEIMNFSQQYMLTRENMNG